MATAMNRTRGVSPPRARGHELRQLLGEQDGVLRTRKEALRTSVPVGTFGVIDDEEHSWDNEEVVVGVSLLELTSQTVQGLEIALRRLETGEYGTCSDCRARISSARLRALPFAHRCRGCQEQRDIAAFSLRRHAGTDQVRP